MILLIDNYDSFTYNLYQYLGEIEPDIKVVRNDGITLDEISKLKPQHIVLSPGPGRPEDAGICVDVVKAFTGKIPILGICLGHQAISIALGGKVDYSPCIVHGKSHEIINLKKGLLKDLPEKFSAGRYHSLCVPQSSLPDCLDVHALTSDNVVMAMAHKNHFTYGLQFHPESILTDVGKKILKNFLKIKVLSMKEILEKLIKGESLTEKQAEHMMTLLMSGEYSDAQIGALLLAFRMKGETVNEVAGCAKVMREMASFVDVDGIDTIDTCGTGGDGGKTYNVSTASAFILAAAGMPVAKHGNHSVSSKCGSADVLAELGVKLELTPEQVGQCIKKTDIGFMFAPMFHSAMKYAIGPRREMKIRTIFNMLGPLTNPAKASYQVIGVFDEKLTNMFANVLGKIGTKRALVVHGKDGMDEITLCDETKVSELKEDGSVVDYTINPEDFGLSFCDVKELEGGECSENAKTIIDLFNGEISPKRDLLCLNAGAALYICGKADSIAVGIKFTQDIIDSGKAKAKLNEFVKVSQEV